MLTEELQYLKPLRNYEQKSLLFTYSQLQLTALAPPELAEFSDLVRADFEIMLICHRLKYDLNMKVCFFWFIQSVSNIITEGYPQSLGFHHRLWDFGS